MKRTINIIILLATAFVATSLCSCKKATKIVPAKNSVTFAINGGVRTIEIECDGKIGIENCPEWLKYEVNDSNAICRILTLTAEENKTGASREASLTLVGDNVSQNLRVEQGIQCTRINAVPEILKFNNLGGKRTVDIDTDGADIAVDVTCDKRADGVPDISATYSNGLLTIVAPQNESAQGEYLVSLSCEGKQAEVKVILEGELCKRCDGKGIIECPKCKGKGGGNFTGGSDGFWDGCKECGGYGYYNPYDQNYEDGRPGSGQITCPDCGGNGK